MGQSQGQQHTGRQYLGRPFSKRLSYFDKRPFQKSLFENVRFLGMAVSQSVVTKSAGFGKPVDKNFALCSQWHIILKNDVCIIVFALSF